MKPCYTNKNDVGTVNRELRGTNMQTQEQKYTENLANRDKVKAKEFIVRIKGLIPDNINKKILDRAYKGHAVQIKSLENLYSDFCKNGIKDPQKQVAEAIKSAARDPDLLRHFKTTSEDLGKEARRQFLVHNNKGTELFNDIEKWHPNIGECEGLIKICLIGNSGAGRTNLVRRLRGETFENQRKSYDWETKIAKLETTHPCYIKLEIVYYGFDSQEDFIRGHYARGPAAHVFCVDVTNPKSFELIQQWKECVDRYCGNMSAQLVVSTKNDEPGHLHQVSRTDLEKYAADNNMRMVHTSAKNNINVIETFMLAVHEAHMKDSFRHFFPEPNLSPIFNTSSASSSSSSSNSGGRNGPQTSALPAVATSTSSSSTAINASTGIALSSAYSLSTSSFSLMPQEMPTATQQCTSQPPKMPQAKPPQPPTAQPPVTQTMQTTSISRVSDQSISAALFSSSSTTDIPSQQTQQTQEKPPNKTGHYSSSSSSTSVAPYPMAQSTNFYHPEPAPSEQKAQDRKKYTKADIAALVRNNDIKGLFAACDDMKINLDDAPDEICCLITQEIMRNPTLVCVSSYVYENEKISEWLRLNGGTNATAEDPTARTLFNKADLVDVNELQRLRANAQSEGRIAQMRLHLASAVLKPKMDAIVKYLQGKIEEEIKNSPQATLTQ